MGLRVSQTRDIIGDLRPHDGESDGKESATLHENWDSRGAHAVVVVALALNPKPSNAALRRFLRKLLRREGICPAHEKGDVAL